VSDPSRSDDDESSYLGEIASDFSERRAEVMWTAIDKSPQQRED
jgi:hypothetical protein